MFRKVLFSRSDVGCTAGLVVDDTKVDVRNVSAVSRLYPATEARKMSVLHISRAYDSPEEAYGHVFPVDIMGNPVKNVETDCPEPVCSWVRTVCQNRMV